MASVSAAVTVFGRQAGDVCLCDTDKIYLAADTAVQHDVTRCCSTNRCHAKPQTFCVNFKIGQITFKIIAKIYFLTTLTLKNYLVTVHD